MSRTRKHAASDREKEAEMTYSRGDQSLWDDGELIRLWNAQLGKQSAENVAPGDDDSDGDASASSQYSRTSSAEEGEDSVELEDSATRGSSTAIGTTGGIPIDHLPRSVQSLVSSFYAAGFEAGRFASSRATKRGESARKRSREE